MTVAELIELLSEQNPSDSVEIDGLGDVTGITSGWGITFIQTEI